MTGATRAAAAWVAGTLGMALGAASAELSAGPLRVDQRTAGRGARQAKAKPPAASVQAAAVYYPDRFEWQRRTPQDAGMDAARLDEAVQGAIASENPATKDLATDLATTFGRNEPFDTPIGSVQPRGSVNGLVVRGGCVVAAGQAMPGSQLLTAGELREAVKRRPACVRRLVEQALREAGAHA